MVGIGALMTAIMQSSSAAMATTLTALAAGTMTLEQGAAIVIGVNIGTTITAGIAALGGSVAAKRTALVHVLFNVVTGVIALAILPIFTRVAAGIDADPAILLAAFHSIFNLLGVLVLLPLSDRFAAIVVRMVSERGPSLLRHLDPRAAEAGNIAIEGVRRTTIEIAGETVAVLREVLVDGVSPARAERLERAAEAVSATREYLSDLRGLSHMSGGERERHLSTIHALDHVGRLVANVVAAESRYSVGAVSLETARRRLDSSLEAIATWIADPLHPAPVETSRQASLAIADERRAQRQTLLDEVARGDTSALEADRLLVAMRWLDECAFYAYRSAEHLRGERSIPDAGQESTVESRE
jgi:phosphate:Na+ symporter